MIVTPAHVCQRGKSPALTGRVGKQQLGLFANCMLANDSLNLLPQPPSPPHLPRLETDF